MTIFAETINRLDGILLAAISGSVAQVIGLTIEADDFCVPVGALARIHRRHGAGSLEAEVVGFNHDRAILMPLGEGRGIARGDSIELVHARARVGVGEGLLGRVLDALGNPLDGKPAPVATASRDVFGSPPAAMKRPPITQPLTTGVRAIDGLFTCGRGQRVGLFSGSGVGKSSLMGMLTRNTDADVIVVCLVGERGRELRDFLDNDLGEAGLKRACVVCATSDQPPLIRVRAAFTATAIAEHFRDQGKNVLLLLDSVTRLALAQREIGLSAGEPPTTRGYPPSVFAMLPRLLERAGANERGTITAFYTVLVEGDDVNEPIADTVRGILDGHIWLSRDLANRGHFPAIRIDDSISRLMSSVTGEDHRALAARLRRMHATYRQSEDLINIGAYQRGSSADIDEAIAKMPAIRDFLQQKKDEKSTLPTTVQALTKSLADGKPAVAPAKLGPPPARPAQPKSVHPLANRLPMRAAR
ncbi:MAG: FliI/YscN family ATPase [Planctomycetes bacterium]|nr:FliI/YscN family ATPase [Planctomycetota bacterium]